MLLAELTSRWSHAPGGRQRVRHPQMVTPWWDYLFCTPEELEPILAQTAWELTEAYPAPPGAGKAGESWPPGQWTAVLALRS
jgi:hypothetical protein